MPNPHPNLAPSSSHTFDKPLFQAGQFIDMQFMASTTFNRSTSKPLLRSLDSQEFGFASNLVNSPEVAPADELFFKGQLLPLQLDHRLHLVQALSSSSCLEHRPIPTIATARVGISSKLATPDLCQDDDVIEFNSCRLEREVSVEYLKDSMQSNKSEDHMLRLNHMQCLQSSKESSSYIIRDDKLKRFSSKTKGFSELDCSACAQNRAADRNGEHGILSWCEDEEPHSCNPDMGTVDYKFSSMNDAMTDPGSSSFRSQNSGFWDSGTDKDMMDSSSSRDSNGSSQDSYFHTNHTHIKAPPLINASHHHHPHSKPMSFNIPWKLALFTKGSCRKQAPPQDSSLTFTKMGFSEDLGKYKASAAPPLHEIKEALLPLKPEREANSYKEEKQLGKVQRRLYTSATNDDGCSANVMSLCKSSTHVLDAGAKKSLVHDGSRSCRMPIAKGVDVGATEEEAKKQRSAAVKERWQMYARRLKPLCEMKRGWMGQFRMDECGKRAYCEVEHGTIYSSTRPANGQMQRKLSHQPSSSNALKGHKLSLQQQKQANGYSYKVLAMSSCPSSTISSPNHSGVLAVLDPNQRTATANKPAQSSSKTPSKLLNHPLKISTSAHDAGASIIKSSIKSSGNALNDGGNHNYRSISTMQELHSALQGAISHCKESNKKLNYAANN